MCVKPGKNLCDSNPEHLEISLFSVWGSVLMILESSEVVECLLFLVTFGNLEKW